LRFHGRADATACGDSQTVAGLQWLEKHSRSLAKQPLEAAISPTAWQEFHLLPDLPESAAAIAKDFALSIHTRLMNVLNAVGAYYRTHMQEREAVDDRCERELNDLGRAIETFKRERDDHSSRGGHCCA
jgi:hypothetical protein